MCSSHGDTATGMTTVWGGSWQLQGWEEGPVGLWAPQMLHFNARSPSVP